MNKLLGAISKGRIRGVLAPLSNRSIIDASGSDTIKFLQNLTTRSIVSEDKIVKAGNVSHYTVFLNEKGRILSECLLYHRPLSHSFFIETSTDCVEVLKKHFDKYKLRNIVIFESEKINKCYKICSLLASTPKELKTLLLYMINTTTDYDVSFYLDPRWPLSLRMIVPSDKDASEIFPKTECVYSDDNSGSIYKWIRLLNGISEGSDEVISEKSIAFEYNMEFLNGITFDKGCYLGQELISRTFHSGEVRKRIFPTIEVIPRQNQPKNEEFGKKFEQSVEIPNLFDDITKVIKSGFDCLIPKEMIQKASPNVDNVLKSQFDLLSNQKDWILQCQSSQIFQPYTLPITIGNEIVPISDFSNLVHFKDQKTGLIKFALKDQEAEKYTNNSKRSRIVSSIWNAGLSMIRLEHFECAKNTGYTFLNTSTGNLLKVILPIWYSKYQHFLKTGKIEQETDFVDVEPEILSKSKVKYDYTYTGSWLRK